MNYIHFTQKGSTCQFPSFRTEEVIATRFFCGKFPFKIQPAGGFDELIRIRKEATRIDSQNQRAYNSIHKTTSKESAVTEHSYSAVFSLFHLFILGNLREYEENLLWVKGENDLGSVPNSTTTAMRQRKINFCSKLSEYLLLSKWNYQDELHN